MIFNDFLTDIKINTNIISNDKELALCLKKIFTHYLAQDTFKLKCIERQINLSIQHTDLIVQNIYKDETFEIRLIYWPPHFSNVIHEHDDVTITGIFSNELLFKTYKHNKQLGYLDDRTMRVKRNEVGYIHSLCFHNVTNETSTPSISLHYFRRVKNSQVQAKKEKLEYSDLEFDMEEIQYIANLNFLKEFINERELLMKMFKNSSLHYQILMIKHAYIYEKQVAELMIDQLLLEDVNINLKTLLLDLKNTLDYE